MKSFSFGNALSHWTNTGGPGGFVWKFALAYALGGVLVAGIGFLIGGVLVFTGGVNEFGQLDTSQLPRLVAYYLWSLVAGVLFWAMFEAAAQRRYQRDQGFSVGIGGDEGRLIVVALLWLLTIVGLYIGIAVLVGVIAFAAGAVSPELAGVVAIALGLLGLAAFLFVVVRLSPAAAMTIRDRKIRFSSAWGATKGRFWPILGAYIVMALIAALVFLVVYIIIAAAVGGLMLSSIDFSAGEPTPEEIAALFLNPASITLGVVLGLLGYFIYGVVLFAFQGIPALVAKTDPKWSGAGSVVNETFS